ncbi:MAG: S8 family serine peptidase [Prevotella sp.]|uniref:S8 family peptidase n=1 Tax=Prevotella sp. TaxID=59823 RepID=UPI002A27725A|nr:S8 family serine peptidase [Prevotella sp.]MDD7319102.1 S8 family serine peptidase [Prevotellaceae bacterium]MDY4019623.1 S8 family serine peptidase [Prevotella sp.]
MKKILFYNNETDAAFKPWKPRGFMGCMGRFLLFLFLLLTMLLLLSLFRRCTPEHYTRDDIPDEILNPPQQPLVPIDTTDTGGFPGRIENPGPNLPGEEDNRLPPVNDDDVVVNNDSIRVIGNALNVILNSDANDDTFRQFASKFKQAYSSDKYKITYYETRTKLLQINVPEEERERMLKELPRKITGISFKVFEEEMLEPHASQPNDMIFSSAMLSWYFDPIQAYDAWQITTGSPNITVAIIDSYFDLRHPDLNSNRIVKPYSVERGTGNVLPPTNSTEDCSHGTRVASQAIGTMNNRAAMCGIAPNCKFMPISLSNYMTSIRIVQALLYAIYQGADVVNLSLGLAFPEYAQDIPIEEQISIAENWGKQLEDIYNYIYKLADERNVTIVWAAGNSNTYTAMDPKDRNENTVRVSAIGPDLKKASFSCFGNFPERNLFHSTVSAPGVNILGAVPNRTYDIGPGTSFAAPLVSGAIALMKSVNPNLSNKQIVGILRNTGKPVTGNNTIGPILQIKDALIKAKQTRGEAPNRRNNNL